MHKNFPYDQGERAKMAGCKSLEETVLWEKKDDVSNANLLTLNESTLDMVLSP